MAIWLFPWAIFFMWHFLNILSSIIIQEKTTLSIISLLTHQLVKSPLSDEFSDPLMFDLHEW